MPDPSNATLIEALHHLRTNFSQLVDDFVDGKLAIWAGSMISAGRLPPLGELLKKLLDGVHARIDASDSNCHFRRWLMETVPSRFHGSCPVTQQPSTWSEITAITDDLKSRYSDVLDKDINAGGVTVSLVWDILRLHEEYSADHLLPDAEHRFLALLIAEGVVCEIVTTNWDELIEKAFQSSRDVRFAPAMLPVVVHRTEINQPVSGARLSKIHGCAKMAKGNPTKYREYLVATRNQFITWLNDPNREAIREHLRAILRQWPALFVGSSGQDFNLQMEFQRIAQQVGPFKLMPPRFVFASTQLEDAHKQVLKALHGDQFVPNEDQFKDACVLGLYGKPLLGALYVLTLFRKAEAIAELGRNDLGAWHTHLVNGIVDWEQLLCDWFERLLVADVQERWRQLACDVPAAISRFVLLYNQCEVPATADDYRELWFEHVGSIRNGKCPATLKLHSVLFLLAVLLKGDRNGTWSMMNVIGTDPKEGQLRLKIGAEEITVFCMPDPSKSLSQMEKTGLIDSDAKRRIAVIYPHGPEPKKSSRPGRPSAASSLPSRRRRKKPAEVWLECEMSEVADVDELLSTLERKLQA